MNIAVLDQDDAIKIAKFLSDFDLYRTRYDFTVSNEKLYSKLDIINIKHTPMFDTKTRRPISLSRIRTIRLRRNIKTS